MAKEVTRKMKFTIAAGRASMAPPLGPALSPTGIDANQFISRFNEDTKDAGGILTPVILTIYDDRTFDMAYKTPPVSALIKKALNLKSGSPTPNIKKVGKLSQAQVLEIVEIKLPDLNTRDVEAAKKIVEGTAKQMGVEIEK